MVVIGAAGVAPWGAEAYAIAMNGVAPPNLPLPLPAGGGAGWHAGPAGRARLVITGTSNEPLALGLGRLTANPGSTLARINGSGTALGVGAFGRFDFDAVVSAENPLPPSP